MIRLNTSDHGGGGISEFQWSESEQVWPFEKAADGSILYCKLLTLSGGLPAGGLGNYAHSISSYDSSKLHRASFKGYEPVTDTTYIESYSDIIWWMDSSYFKVYTGSSFAVYSGTVQLIYGY